MVHHKDKKEVLYSLPLPIRYVVLQLI